MITTIRCMIDLESQCQRPVASIEVTGLFDGILTAFLILEFKLKDCKKLFYIFLKKGLTKRSKSGIICKYDFECTRGVSSAG